MSLCEWPVDYGSCGTCPPLDGPENAALRERMEQAATEFLWNVTGRRFSVCETTVRPCVAAPTWRPSTFTGRGPHTGRLVLQPVLVDGQWRNMGCGCAGACGCSTDGARSIRLPGPVESVVSVTIDGDTLPDSAWRLAYGAVLLRTDGGRWPVAQNLNSADDAAGAFAITYRMGIPVPAGGQLAAGRLACELAKAFCGAKDCKLPERVQTVTRQGVTVGLMDTFEGLDKGRTGIWSIDSWIESVTRPAGFSAVASPDVQRAPRGVILR